MADTVRSTAAYLSLRQRLAILVFYAVALYCAGGMITGSWLPTGGDWIWWVSAVALYVLTTLSAPFFIRPRDSLANAIGSGIMLLTIDLTAVSTLQDELEAFRWASLALAGSVGALGVAAITIHESSRKSGTVGDWSSVPYKLTVPLGRGPVMFTPPALVSIIGFHQGQLSSVLWLTALWIFVVAIKPVELFTTLLGVFQERRQSEGPAANVGHVIRVDDPNLIRVSLTSPKSWKADRLHIACLPGNRIVDVIPLFVQTQDNELVGTGLCSEGLRNTAVSPGEVWAASGEATTEGLINQLSGGDAPADLIGFIVEDSRIAAIRFEVTDEHPLEEGVVVFVRDRDKTIYYQVLEALTKEEVFTQNPRGTHVVMASQLGTLEEGKFRKYGWVPSMNAPVFLPKRVLEASVEHEDGPEEFVLGSVAQTGMLVKADLADMADYHTAVLGVTGTGKTEFVLDVIEAHASAGRKVFCVDCTGEYEHRLSHRTPRMLGFDPPALQKLDGLVNAAEHGEFGGAKEKGALHKSVVAHQGEVAAKVAEFMDADQPQVGIFDLPDIANTRATLRATEMYISAIFAWAKKNRKKRDVVVVLEEAHTVVPEWNFFRHDKADTDAVVGRMAQIALQGRKYGVGLLLVSQRTALVSKTLLSQCNTCICFAMYDKTGLDYLESVFASEHVRAIPNLRFLQGVAFGKAIQSERPIIFEIEYDQRKEDASRALDERSDSAGTDPTVSVSAETAEPSDADQNDDGNSSS